ncbi:MAG TPA: hypothetical protein VF210_03880 [Pseudomonadales bacterium]
MAAATPPEPTRPPINPERRAAFLAADWRERQAIHRAVAQRKAQALEARRALGGRYLERHPEGSTVPWHGGVLRLDLPDATKDARQEALALAAGREAQANNRSLEFTVLGRDFPAESAAVQLATSPLLLVPMVRYFGMLPVLFNVFVARAHTTGFIPNSSHMFHIDPEDVISHKAFIHLTEVDDDCGPLHVLPADRTEHVLEAVGYRGIDRVSDDTVNRLAGLGSVVRFTGPPGTVALADSSRCLHFGGRPRHPEKPMRYTLVFQYLLPTSFLFPIDGDSLPPRHLPNLTPSGDELWDALIGACHT